MPPTVKTDNPAGRLHVVLTDARMIGDATMLDAWGTALGLSGESDEEKIAGLFALHRLVDDVEVKIRQIEDMNEELYLGEMSKIRETMQVLHIFRPWKEIREHLSAVVIDRVAFCAEELSRHSAEGVISNEQLSELQAEVESLVEQVVEANIDEELRKVLCHYLELVRIAILRYRVTGGAGLMAAIERSAGGLWFHQEEIKKARVPELLRGFAALLKNAYDITTTALKLKKLLSEPLLRLIGEESG